MDVPKELVWRAWTEPKHLTPWFCPLPWKTIDCEIDLRPGGLFRTVMLSPEGKQFPSTGCYLEVIKNARLVWTSALLPGFRPVFSSSTSTVDFPFTAMLEFATQGNGTKYTATVIHADEAGRQKHVDMGFHEGWGTALDQLIEYAKKM